MGPFKSSPVTVPNSEIFISDDKEQAENMRKQPDLVGLSENRWKNAIFSKSSNVPILKLHGVIPTTKADPKII